MPLDPEIAAYLEVQKTLPPRAGMTLGQIRERMVDAAGRFGGERLAVARVADFTVGNGVAVRDYGAPDGAMLVYFHGGRFVSGGLETHDRLCRRLALESGRRVLAVDYRLAPEHRCPAAVEDVCAAVDWALKESGRVAVAGDSAGACLATVAAAERRAEIECQVLIYPMIDATRSLASHVEFGEGWGPSSADMQHGWDEYVPAGVDPRDGRVSPFFADDLEGMPPALVLTAEFDCLRDEGEMYAHRLGEAGNRVELKRCLGAIHGFVTLAGVSRLAREAIEYAGAYLRRVTPRR